MCFANGRQVWQGQRLRRSPCQERCSQGAAVAVMRVKSHDQAFNALEPVPYSLFVSAELHFDLQSLYDNSLKLRLSTDL